MRLKELCPQPQRHRPLRGGRVQMLVDIAHGLQPSRSGIIDPSHLFEALRRHGMEISPKPRQLVPLPIAEEVADKRVNALECH